MNKRRIFFILVFIVTIISPIIIKSPISLMPLVFIFLTMILSLIYILTIWKQFEIIVEDTEVKKYERLDSVKYDVKIRNKGLFVFPYTTFEMTLETLDGNIVESYRYNFLLNPREERNLDIDIKFPHIGKYVVKINDTKISGIFDLFSMSSKSKWKEELLITPKFYEVGNIDIDTTNPIFNVNYNVPNKIDGGEFEDIREYIPGDPIKNIHWKLSAHADEYMTRIRNTDAISGISIYIDFKVDEGLKFKQIANINDNLVESGYSIGLYTLDKSYGINYVYSESNNPMNIYPKAYDEIETMINNLPMANENERYSIDLLLMEYANSLMTFDNIVILTSNINNNLINTVSSLKENRKYPVLIYIRENKDIDEKYKKQLIKNNIEHFTIESAEDLKSMLGGVR